MRIRTLLPALFLAAGLAAQTAPSDSLFNTDQVVNVELYFGDIDFWSTLTQYYENDLGETLTGDVIITDQTGTRTYFDVAVDLKGNSSYSHPGNKKSFKIDFNDNISGQKYHGMTKIHLNNCFKDPTFMREKIYFDFCRAQGVLAPRVCFANVSINGTFWGFYNLVEPVDGNFLDRWADDNNGNLFKAGDNFGAGGPGGGMTPADLHYYGPDQSSYTSRYELKTNESEDDWSDLIELLEELNNSSDQVLAAQFPSKWEWRPMLRSLALDNIFSNLDSYINSARNYYIYHDSTTFKWNWIKWDANEAFGSYGGPGVGNLLNLAPNYALASRPLMTKVMNVPSFYNDYLVEYCAVLEAFTNDGMDPHIDAIKTLIEAHVAADGNKQFSTSQFATNVESDISTGGGPGGGTVYGLKSFISSRSNYLSGALDCASVGLVEVGHGSSSMTVSPNPTHGSLTVQSTNGLAVSRIEVSDLQGRLILAVQNTSQVDLSFCPSGVYFVRSHQGGQVVVTRVEKI
ncbi:MAG TPA: CotH kinase family protein [Flavobacteriales bacterium]|nr:CotH kinase family protein [Flavobacteriales bacterium]